MSRKKLALIAAVSAILVACVWLASTLVAQETTVVAAPADTDVDLSVGLRELDLAFGVANLLRTDSDAAQALFAARGSDAVTAPGLKDQVAKLESAVPPYLEADEAVVTLAVTATREGGKGIAWKILDFSKKTKNVQHHSIEIRYRRPPPSDAQTG